MKPAVLFILPDIAPTQYFSYYPLLQLHKNREINFEILMETNVHERNIIRNNLIVMSRNHSQKTISIINILENRNIPYIYDLDDDLFQSRNYYSNSEGETNESLNILSYVLQQANLVRVYSDGLLKTVKAINHKCKKMHPPIFWSLINSRNPQPKKINITYTTSRINQDPFFGNISAALRNILIDNNNIEVSFWGYLPHEFKNHKNVRFVPFIRNYQEYLLKFSTMGIDIGLAPMEDNDFCRAKTNNKFREYGACKIAGIYSKVELYNEIIDKRTGLLIENTVENWENAIRTLINNQSLREDIINNTYNYLRERYSEEDYINNWRRNVINTLSDHDRNINTLITIDASKINKYYLFEGTINKIKKNISGRNLLDILITIIIKIIYKIKISKEFLKLKAGIKA